MTEEIEQKLKEAKDPPKSVEVVEPEKEIVTTTPLLDAATKTTAALKEQLDRADEVTKRQEELAAKTALGGQSMAGTEVKEKTEEEKTTDEADELMGGYMRDGEKLSDPIPLQKDDPKPKA